MSYSDLQPLHDMPLDKERMVLIGQTVLATMQQQPQLLSQYADHIVQAQQRILSQKTTQLSTQLGQLLEGIMTQLEQSKVVIKPRQYSKWQQWLGLDIEQQARHDEIYYQLARDVKTADHLNRQLVEHYQSHQEQITQLQALRLEMAYYVRAAEHYITNSSNELASDFKARIQQKINTLMTAQTATDMAFAQLKLAEQVNLSLMDRFKEVVTILIPAWHQHVASLAYRDTPQQLEQLNQARHRLLQVLAPYQSHPTSVHIQHTQD